MTEAETVTEAETMTPAGAVTITDRAAARIAALLAEEDDASGLRFRVQVSGGGCSGFQYGFCFDDARNEDDHVFVHNGIEVVVDGVSLDLLDRAEIDYVEELIGASFQVRNPNAVSSCGCGSSFSIG